MKNIYALVFLLLVGVSFSQPSFVMPSTICEGGQITVNANTGTMSITGYSWYSNWALISAPNGSVTSITFSNPGIDIITLDVTDGSTITSTTHTINVLSNPTVVISVAGPTAVICPPPTYIGMWMWGYGAVNYTWMPGGSTGVNYTVMPQPSSATTFTLYGEDANGCIDTVSQYVDVHPAPWISASGPSIVCSGVNDCFTASGSTWVYQWNGPCGFSDNSQNPCMTLGMGCGGTFTVGGSDMNGCVAITTIGITVSPCTSIDEMKESGYDLLFPNPAKDWLFIPEDVKNVELLDIAGRAVMEKTIRIDEDRRLDLRNMESGIYIVRLKRADQISVQKFVKE